MDKLIRSRPNSMLFGAVVTLLTLIGPAGNAKGAPSPELQATGSSFAAIAIDQWVGQTSSLYGLNVNFQVSSSQQGLTAFAQNQVDFEASEFTYAAGDVAAPTVPYQYLPDVGGAVAFMYNLEGINGQPIKDPVLNAQTIDGIFSGKISDWDEDSAGESYLLSDYLLHQDGVAFQAYQRAVGDSTAGQSSANWPISQSGAPAGYPNYSSLTGQDGDDGVANYVSALSSDGSIGYLETAYAIQHSFPVASLVNASGNAVQPSSENDATALEKATLTNDRSANLTGVFRDKKPNAYPLSGYSYVVAPCSPSLAKEERPRTKCAGNNSSTSSYPADSGAELADFLNFAVCQGQQKVALFGFAVLPPRLVKQAFSGIDRINGADEPRSPTAANCPNPYVDGELYLP